MFCYSMSQVEVDKFTRKKVSLSFRLGDDQDIFHTVEFCLFVCFTSKS